MHKGFTLWFTGLSGAGKSTISRLIEGRLRALGAKVEVLDGDMVRTRLSKGLGFSKQDRDENIRRIGFVCELLSRNGVIAIVAAISPYRGVREEVRARKCRRIQLCARADRSREIRPKCSSVAQIVSALCSGVSREVLTVTSGSRGGS